MSDWDSFLEALALECESFIISGSGPWKADKRIVAALRAKLLPLLEAGQAMRDEAPSILGKPWDAAKEAALKESE